MLSETFLPPVPLVRFSRCSYSLSQVTQDTHPPSAESYPENVPGHAGSKCHACAVHLCAKQPLDWCFAWSCGGSCAVEVGDAFFHSIHRSGSRGRVLERSCALVSGTRSPSPLLQSLVAIVDIHDRIAPSRFARNLLVHARARASAEVNPLLDFLVEVEVLPDRAVTVSECLHPYQTPSPKPVTLCEVCVVVSHKGRPFHRSGVSIPPSIGTHPPSKHGQLAVVC